MQCADQEHDAGRGHRNPLKDAERARLVAPHVLQVDDRERQPERAAEKAQQTQQPKIQRSEEHTSELQSLMRISYAVFCLKKKTNKTKETRRKHEDKT